MRRRLITAPTSSSPTTLQLFLPRSIPRTAIFIGMVLPSVAAASLRCRKRGAGHPISFPEVVDQLARDKQIDPATIEVWFADEARIGQKNKITRRWARRGSRPSAPHDQRAASTYIFGAICPKNGKGATLVPLPPKCPELNPVENIWQFIRDNWLSNRVFRSYDDILEHCCFAWNKLVDQPWTIMSIGLRDWAHRF